MAELIVGLPVHNAMPFLPAAVESLLGQTYRSFSVIALDDGSSDDSLAYLRSVADPRLTVLTQPRQGLTATLNRMLELAGDAWLVRHDADDVAFPDRLRLLTESMERHPGAAMFYTRARYHQEGRSFGTFRTTAAPPVALRLVTQAGWLLSICHPTVALHAPTVRRLGGYRFDLHVEDLDLWWRMALRHEIRFIPQETVGFRLREESVSSSRLALQARNTLYVQYLLLSELCGRPPRPLEEVWAALQKLMPHRRLAFRDRVRRANVHLGSGRYPAAAGNLVRAFLASPAAFASRVRYELRKPDIAVFGEDPLRFAEIAEELW